MTTSAIPTYNIGIDIGSTTLKLVVIDDNCDIVFSDYRRHNTDIREALKAAYKKMYDTVGNCNMRVKFTGSVGMGYAERFSAPFVGGGGIGQAYRNQIQPCAYLYRYRWRGQQDDIF